jgi:CRISPR system Cascade subunit CasB
MTVHATRADLERPAAKLEKEARRALGSPGDRAALRRSLGRPTTHPAVVSAHRLVAPLLPSDLDLDRSDRSAAGVEAAAIERAFYTVAALIAAQPRAARDAYIGAVSSDPEATDETASLDDPPPSDSPAGTGGASTSDAALVPVDGRSGWRSLGRSIAEVVNRLPAREQTDAYRRLDARLRLVCRQDLDGVHRQLPRLIQYLHSEQIEINWVRLTVDLAAWGLHADDVSARWLRDYYRSVRLAQPGDDVNDSTPDLSSSAIDAESEMP